MSSTLKTLRRRPAACFGIIALIALPAFLLLIGPPEAVAQLSGVGSSGKSETTELGLPASDLFCVGKKCAGQTCDEVNDTCVGNVTLQAPMGAPLIGLKKKERLRFEAGRVLFDKTFVAEDGLGPVFNKDSCGGCHSRPLGGSGTITVTRFGHIDVDDDEFLFDPLEELGGSLLNKETIAAECAEVIPLPETNIAANRLTNSTLGFGLVEAIPDAAIEFNALDPPAGVSGRVHIVPILEQQGAVGVGRFGWKCQLKTVLSFTADAMLQEMGITNRIFPEDNPPNNDLIKLAACDSVADPEDVPDDTGVEFLDRVTDFQRFLAPPPQTPRSGMTGEAIFESIGCDKCHLRTFSTADDKELEDAIRGREIQPYTDFLLHDMGFNADLIEQGDAGLFEIRTTPLWGLRVRDPLWHDGRVAGGTFDFRILNAVDQHNTDGSEAQASAQAFFGLSGPERDAVIDFLDSLGRREFDMDGDGDVDDADAAVVDECSAAFGPYTADDLCAIADPDQDGDVDGDDLELLAVALGLVRDDDEDEDEDEDGDDENTEGISAQDIQDDGTIAGGLTGLTGGGSGGDEPGDALAGEDGEEAGSGDDRQPVKRTGARRGASRK